MAYLEQIATTTKPPAPKESFLHSKKIFIVLGVAVFLSIFLMIIGNLMGSGSDKEQDAIMRLNVRTTNLLKVIQDYNRNIKSSSLRSMGTSLSTQITDLNRNINAYVEEHWKSKIPDSITEEEGVFTDELINTLENARLNGYLDRVFAREFALQIALLNSLQTEILERTKDEFLITTINNALPSFRELHTEFANYTDPSG